MIIFPILDILHPIYHMGLELELDTLPRTICKILYFGGNLFGFFFYLTQKLSYGVGKIDILTSTV